MKFLNYSECLSIKSGYIITVNMQHIYESYHNKTLQTAIFDSENAHTCIDGRGAYYLFKRLNFKNIEITYGNTLLNLKLNSFKNAKVLIVGSNSTTISKIRLQYPNIDFLHDSSQITLLNSFSLQNLSKEISLKYGGEFDLVALALGVPKQELFAKELVRFFPQVPIFCIGGSFEIISGLYRRAPALIQSIGLEGFWRLALQPSYDRILRVVKSYLFFFYFILNSQKLVHLISKTKRTENESDS